MNWNFKTKRIASWPSAENTRYFPLLLTQVLTGPPMNLLSDFWLMKTIAPIVREHWKDQIPKSCVSPVPNGAECLLLCAPFHRAKGSQRRDEILTESSPICACFVLPIFTSFKTFFRFMCNTALGQNVLLYMRVPSSHGNQFHCWIYFLSWKAD